MHVRDDCNHDSCTEDLYSEEQRDDYAKENAKELCEHNHDDFTCDNECEETHFDDRKHIKKADVIAYVSEKVSNG